MRDFNRLYSNCYKFMTSKKNDVELMEISKQIRFRAKEDGFTDDEINEQMRKARENRDEANASNQQSAMGTPEEKPPAAPKEEVQQLHDMQTKKDRGRSNASIRRDIPTGVEESRGGRPERKSKLSILDIADGKQTI